MFRRAERHVVHANQSTGTAAYILQRYGGTIHLSTSLALMGPVFVTPVPEIISIGLDLRRSAFGL
jgi:hypothetical protein